MTCDFCTRRALARLTLPPPDGASPKLHCWRHVARAHAFLRDTDIPVSYRWDLLPGTLLGNLARVGPFARAMTDADVARGRPPVLRARRD
jgi:hypothetical protein